MTWNSTTWVKSTKNLLLPKSNKEMQRKQQKKKNSRNKIATPNLEIVEKLQLEQKTGEAKNWIDIL